MRIFGPERAAVRTGRRKLHKEEFHNLYLSPDKSKMVKIMIMQ
jgi:hypothetical protein